jgi:CheY-like chemotaxis protein
MPCALPSAAASRRCNALEFDTKVSPSRRLGAIRRLAAVYRRAHIVRREQRPGGHLPAEVGMSAILVIDDDVFIREGVRFVLQRAGHAVTTAADGREGFATYRKADFDLVITDLVMPGYDGLSAIRAITEYDLTAKIVAMSGAAGNSPLLAAAERIGAMATLAKPFRPAALLDIVASCLAGPCMSQPLPAAGLPLAS